MLYNLLVKGVFNMNVNEMMVFMWGVVFIIFLFIIAFAIGLFVLLIYLIKIVIKKFRSM